MKPAVLALALFAPLLAAPAHAGSEKALADAVLPAKARLKVSSPAFAEGGRIPQDASAYGRNVSPALNWSGAPAGTRSFVVMAEDPDAPGAKPFDHWLVVDIPAQAKGMPAGGLPSGARAGRNSTGKDGYWGPRPPAGGDHHYHFEVFALDQPLNLRRDGGREEVLSAMRGHVLAKGETVGLYRKP